MNNDVKIKTVILYAIIYFILMGSIAFAQYIPNEVSFILTCITGILAITFLYSKIKWLGYRIRLLKELKRENLEYVKIQESNQYLLFLSLLFLYYPAIGIFEVSKYLSINPSLTPRMIFYSLYKNYPLYCLNSVILLIIYLLLLIQVLFNHAIVSKDRVIFSDGLIFYMNDIDIMEYYHKRFVSKKKKVIIIGKGFFFRELIIPTKDLDQVRTLLHAKRYRI
jgi:hypothetical protein